jgi:hypothetical protein
MREIINGGVIEIGLFNLIMFYYLVCEIIHNSQLIYKNRFLKSNNSSSFKIILLIIIEKTYEFTNIIVNLNKN